MQLTVEKKMENLQKYNVASIKKQKQMSEIFSDISHPNFNKQCLYSTANPRQTANRLDSRPLQYHQKHFVQQ
jgi:hypothetical protein